MLPYIAYMDPMGCESYLGICFFENDLGFTRKIKTEHKNNTYFPAGGMADSWTYKIFGSSWLSQSSQKKKHQFLAPIDLLLHPAGYRRLAAFSVKKAVEHLRSPLPHFFAIKMEGITGGTDSIYKAFF
jgi:hypothetical protein